ncbi:MAG: hypothetical protein AAFX10_06715 [Pseudomonadota bacterium]
MNETRDFLDQCFPLKGASHADVVDYAIVIPMRYAECVAILKDGTEARFREPRQLIGWSGPAERRRFYFQGSHKAAVVRTSQSRRRRIREVRVLEGFTVLSDQAVTGGRTSGAAKALEKVVGRDGGLLKVVHDRLVSDFGARIASVRGEVTPQLTPVAAR